MSTLSHWVAAGLAATMLSHALPASADDGQPRTASAQWTKEAKASLRRALVEPRPLGRPAEPAGVADVVFSVTADGRAANVRLLHGSGHRTLDGIALGAVRRIRTKAATPPELADGQPVVARIFVAGGDRPLDDRSMREMVARTAAKNRWAENDRQLGEYRPRIDLAAGR